MTKDVCRGDLEMQQKELYCRTVTEEQDIYGPWGLKISQVLCFHNKNINSEKEFCMQGSSDFY